jgi:8-oxo-dGTP pyrophosphatase MutT (NUDIX family)
MAGMAFVAKFKNNYYFLFGRENKYALQKYLYSDFGGHQENNETLKITAIREGYEETSGMLGNIGVYKRLLEKDLVKTYSLPKKDGGYTTYLVNIKYDKKIPFYHNNMFNFVNRNKHDLVQNQENGLFEKDRLRWFSIQELKTEKDMFRPFYVKILNQIIKDYDNIKP